MEFPGRNWGNSKWIFWGLIKNNMGFYFVTLFCYKNNFIRTQASTFNKKLKTS